MDAELKRLFEKKKKLQDQLAYVEIMLATQPMLQSKAEEAGGGLSPFTIYRGGVIVKRDKLKDEIRDIDVDIARFEERVKAMAAKSAKPILLEKVRGECEKRKLPRGVTIDPETKYAIASAAGIKPIPKRKDFKSGDPAYQQISKYMSELGYKRRGAAKYQ